MASYDQQLNFVSMSAGYARDYSTYSIYIYMYNIYIYGTHGLVGKASVPAKPRTWVRVLASVRCLHLFRCVLSSVLPLQSFGRSNFDKGLHILTTLIKKDILMRTAVLYMYICHVPLVELHGDGSIPTSIKCSS